MATPRSTLAIELREQNAVLHERPVRVHGHRHLHLLLILRTRGRAHHANGDNGARARPSVPRHIPPSDKPRNRGPAKKVHIRSADDRHKPSGGEDRDGARESASPTALCRSMEYAPTAAASWMATTCD